MSAQVSPNAAFPHLFKRPEGALLADVASEFAGVVVSRPTYVASGALIGAPTVRLTLTDPAARGAVKIGPLDVVKRVLDSAEDPIMVSVAGDSVRYMAEDLITELNKAGCPVVIESDCTFVKPWMDRVMHMTIVPAAPSSGHPTHIDRVLNALRHSPRHGNGVSVLVRVETDNDLAYAIATLKKVSGKGASTRAAQLFVQPVAEKTALEGTANFAYQRIRTAERFAAVQQALMDEGRYLFRVLPPLDVLISGESHGQ